MRGAILPLPEYVFMASFSVRRRGNLNFIEAEGSLPCSLKAPPIPRSYVTFHNKPFFYGEELLASRPTPKLEDLFREYA
jgi:hypothetical protein